MYVTTNKATKLIGVHYNTLKNWREGGRIKSIKTDTGRYLYDVDEFISRKEKEEQKNVEDKRK